MTTKWYEFLESIREARNKLGDPEIIWYRGHSSGSWKLEPSLHRLSSDADKEKTLFEEFRRLALLMSKNWDNHWETLFDMQHYGVPTRLLDWTETLGVAVAFAVNDHHPSHGDLAVYVLDPVKLNSNSGLRSIKDIPDEKFEYQAVYWHSDPFSPTYPIAIAPPFQNERMLAQSGTFTIHGNDRGAIEELAPDAVVKVVLPESTIDGAREFIEYADLNPHRIYPDLLGIASHLKRKYLGL